MIYFYEVTKEEIYRYPFTGEMALVVNLVNKLANVVKENNVGNGKKFIFWCRGSSGAIVASLLCAHFPDSIINHVKKPGEKAHSNYCDIWPNKEYYNIFVDDFIVSGETFKYVKYHAEEMGVVLDDIWLLDSYKPAIICDEVNVSVNGIYYKINENKNEESKKQEKLSNIRIECPRYLKNRRFRNM